MRTRARARQRAVPCRTVYTYTDRVQEFIDRQGRSIYDGLPTYIHTYNSNCPYMCACAAHGGIPCSRAFTASNKYAHFYYMKFNCADSLQ